jgi:hypothetical protein
MKMEHDKIAKNLLEKKVCSGCLHVWAHHLFSEQQKWIHDSREITENWCEFHNTRPEEDTCENWKWSFMAVFKQGREHS